MKKYALYVIALAVAGTISLHAQYQTNLQYYSNSFRVCDGTKQTFTPGFLWWGYFPTPPWYGTVHFVLSGVLPSGALNTTQSYVFSDSGPGCPAGPLSAPANCAGISVAETNLPANGRYAIAGAYDKGVFFTSLTPAGAVISSMLYPFPYNPSVPVGKPMIVEEPGGTNQFYIAGRFDKHLYILKVDAVGNLLWSQLYQMGTNIAPEAITVSPLSPTDVYLVGHTESPAQIPPPCSGPITYPIFMRVDGGSGNILQCRAYANPLPCTYNGTFNSIIPSGINPGVPEFIVGGGVDPTPFTGKSWILKLDVNGAVIQSKVIENSGALGGSPTGPITTVIERKNTLALYEYYCLTTSPAAGMSVLKLDSNFDPFPWSSPNALYNEFNYNSTSSPPSQPTTMTFNETSMVPGHNVGIQVYGTNFPTAAVFFVSAYFNGETNCNKNLTTLVNSQPYNVNPLPIMPSSFSNLSQCSNFVVNNYGGNNTLNTPCFGYMGAGSNQKPAGVNGLNADDETESSFSLYPNPVSGKAILRYTGAGNTPVKITICNALGQLVSEIKNGGETSAGAMETEIDFAVLQLPAGVYFVQALINGEQKREKVVYTK
ncbi:MAG: T9SS type A sorting domain-containing protein [Bacteroidota bacterium]